jgi:hypothetical protein
MRSESRPVDDVRGRAGHHARRPRATRNVWAQFVPSHCTRKAAMPPTGRRTGASPCTGFAHGSFQSSNGRRRPQPWACAYSVHALTTAPGRGAANSSSVPGWGTRRRAATRRSGSNGATIFSPPWTSGILAYSTVAADVPGVRPGGGENVDQLPTAPPRAPSKRCMPHGCLRRLMHPPACLGLL